ncbi:Replication protein A 70 kDa DNA-binding subunit A [Linum perenne]
MAYTLLSKLDDATENTICKLRLLHAWPSTSPADPSKIYSFCTLWADETGSLILGVANRSLIDYLRDILTVKFVYMVSKFSLQPPRDVYRPCSHGLSIIITHSTVFEDVTDINPNFCQESFEFVPFKSLDSRVDSNAFLTDVIGRLTSVGGLTHESTRHGDTTKQKIMLKDHVYGSFSQLLDGRQLLNLDSESPVIIAVSTLTVSNISGELRLNNTSATRIVVNPLVPERESLAAVFQDTRGTLIVFPSELQSATDLGEVVRQSFRTIQQLLDLRDDYPSSDARFRCLATIVHVDQKQPWFYIGCTICARSVRKYQDGFWCTTHRRIRPDQTKNYYKLKLMVQDDSADAMFAVLGLTAELLVGMPAGTLAQRFPNYSFVLPPELYSLCGQRFIFEVHFPPNAFSTNFQFEFSVTRTWPSELATSPKSMLPPSTAMPPLPEHASSFPAHPLEFQRVATSSVTGGSGSSSSLSNHAQTVNLDSPSKSFSGASAHSASSDVAQLSPTKNKSCSPPKSVPSGCSLASNTYDVPNNSPALAPLTPSTLATQWCHVPYHFLY